jgi:hypothetical protein
MTQQELDRANSSRITSLAKKLRKKDYRDGYVASHAKTFLAHQITALRGDKSQAEFGEVLNKPQPVVSRLQNPHYGKYTLQTLLDVASKLDIALIVRFVDYPTFLKLTNDYSDQAFCPVAFSEEQVDRMATDKPAPDFRLPLFDLPLFDSHDALTAQASLASVKERPPAIPSKLGRPPSFSPQFQEDAARL